MNGDGVVVVTLQRSYQSIAAALSFLICIKCGCRVCTSGQSMLTAYAQMNPFILARCRPTYLFCTTCRRRGKQLTIS